MDKIKLKNCINIQIGLILSRAGAKQIEFIKPDVAEKVSSIDTYNYKVITLRAINDFWELILPECDNFKSKEPLTKRYLTQKNDILIRLFTPIKACLINEDNENLVIPSQFGIIKINERFKNKLLPEYLHFLMQQKSFIKQIEKIEESFQLRSIKTCSIEDIEIKIPNVEKQKRFIFLYKLMKYKEQLANRLNEQEKLYNEIMLEKLIKGEI